MSLKNFWDLDRVGFYKDFSHKIPGWFMARPGFFFYGAPPPRPAPCVRNMPPLVENQLGNLIENQLGTLLRITWGPLLRINWGTLLRITWGTLLRIT